MGIRDRGGTYQWMGSDALGLNLDLSALDAEDFVDYGLWKRLNPANLITESTTYAALAVTSTVMAKFSGEDPGLTGDSTSFYGLIDRNDVRSEVLASIDAAQVDADGDLTVQALELSLIHISETTRPY